MEFNINDKSLEEILDEVARESDARGNIHDGYAIDPATVKQLEKERSEDKKAYTQPKLKATSKPFDSSVERELEKRQVLEQVEKALIGIILQDNSFFLEVQSMVKGGEFFDKTLGKVWGIIDKMMKEDKKVDLNTLSYEVTKRQDVSVRDVVDCADTFITTSRALDYAKVIHGAFLKREQAESVKRMQMATSDDSLSAEESLRVIQEETMRQVERSIEDIGIEDSSTALKALQDSFDGNEGRFIPTGYRDLDKIIRGFRNGNFIVVGAYPSVGKTQFALKCALRMIKRQGLKVGFFSFEQTKVELMERAISIVSRIPLSRIQDKEKGIPGEQHGEEGLEKKYEAAYLFFKENKIVFDFTRGDFIHEVLYKVKLMKQKYGVDIIFIDQLSFISSPLDMKNANTTYQKEYIVKQLQVLAGTLSIPIVLIAQLYQDRSKRSNGSRPGPADFKDTSSLIEAADIALMLHRVTVNEDGSEHIPDDDKYFDCECVVAKCRNAIPGVVPLIFSKETADFDDVKLEKLPI